MFSTVSLGMPRGSLTKTSFCLLRVLMGGSLLTAPEIVCSKECHIEEVQPGGNGEARGGEGHRRVAELPWHNSGIGKSR